MGEVAVKHLLVVVDLVQNGTHEHPHDSGKDEPCAIVGCVTPVADPELPEDHPELSNVSLGVLVLEAQRLAALLGDTELLNQLLILPVNNKLVSGEPTCY